MGSRDREYPAMCARCGKETTVPFKPNGVRPVYCSECLKLVRGYTLESFIEDNHHRHDIIKLFTDPYYAKTELIIVRKVCNAIQDELSTINQLYRTEMLAMGTPSVEKKLVAKWKHLLDQYVDLNTVKRGELQGLRPDVLEMLRAIFPNVKHYSHGGPPGAPFRYAPMEAAEASHEAPKKAIKEVPKEAEEPAKIYQRPSQPYAQTKSSSKSKKIAVVAVIFLTVMITGYILISLIPPSTFSINGQVFNDINENGALDSIDPGYSGVAVYLVNGSGFHVASDIANATGYYGFSNLTKGSYTIYITLPSGYYNSTPTNLFVNITGASLTGINFGLKTTYSINGHVFNDVNENGNFDGIDSGYSGAQVYLINASGFLIANKTTDAKGNYSFCNLTYGVYRIGMELPYGCIRTAPTERSVTISGANATGIDFGFKNLLVNPRVTQYKYVLRGTTGTITFTVYSELYNYLTTHENPYGSYQEVTLRYVNNADEKGEIARLAGIIKNITIDKDDQARIAISLVQNIPYAYYGINDWKYPYEVLFTDRGVCGDKAKLMVCLLRELGYGCVLFEFNRANHEAVGINCPIQYAYANSCAFVEASTPSIITFWQGDYYGGVTLPSHPDSVIQIYNGSSFNSVYIEYADAQTYYSLINMGSVLDEYHYNLWLSLVNKYGLEVG